MPKLPTDMGAARAHAKCQAAKRDEARKREREALERDEKAIRGLANELRVQAGEPPLRDDEPVQAIICRRGRR